METIGVQTVKTAAAHKRSWNAFPPRSHWPRLPSAAEAQGPEQHQPLSTMRGPAPPEEGEAAGGNMHGIASQLTPPP